MMKMLARGFAEAMPSIPRGVLRRMRIALGVVGLMCLPLTAYAAGAKSARTDSLLRELDRAIVNKEQLAADRRQMITESRRDLAEAATDQDRYNIYRSLYSQYRSYMGDSARWVAEQRLKTAEALGDPNRIMSSRLNLAESYSQAGDYYHALEILDSLPRGEMERYHRRYLYQVYAKTWERMSKADAIRSNAVAYDKLRKSYLDSLLTVTPADSRSHLYLEAELLAEAGHADKALPMVLKANADGGDAVTAKDLTQTAAIFRALNRTDEQMASLARAAIIDLHKGVRDYSALPALALLLNESGDHDRAYSYIRCALEDARLCNAKSRTSEILELVPLIDAQYNENEVARRRLVWILFGVLALSVVALSLALRAVRRRMLLIRDYSERLNHVNAELEESNRSLEESNHRLNESNREKVKAITEVFDAHSGFISRTEKFRKQILTHLASQQPAKARKLVESDELDNGELRELYSRFDSVFLRLYPQFIAEYNSKARPEARVDENSASLTSEMRVLALMKIGITRSSRIAELLHYTPQTVYNYKVTLRNSLMLTKDEFDAWVQHPLP